MQKKNSLLWKKWIVSLLYACIIVMMMGGPVVLANESKRAQDVDMAVLDRFVQQQMDEQRIPGLALGIVHKDQVVQTRGYGQSGTEQAVTEQTPFYVGSMTKAFTALAIMQLVEAGQMELDAPVQQYLPWFQLADEQAAAQLSVRHILNQTSGIPADIPQERSIWLGESSVSSLEEYVRSLNTMELATEIGSTYNYSNTNYAIAGLLVEVVSGQSYSEYVERNIFEPLDMTNSFTEAEEASEHGLAQGHQVWFGFPRPANAPDFTGIAPAAILSSSVDDMTRFLLMQMNGGEIEGTRLISEEGVETLYTPPADPEQTNYGMGWIEGGSQEKPLIWHNGHIGIGSGVMMFAPQSEWGVVVLTNVGGLSYSQYGVIEQMAQGILSKLEGGDLVAPNVSVGQMHVISNVILGVISLLLLVSVAFLFRWEKKFARRLQSWRYRWLIFTMLAVTLLIELLLPLLVVLYVAPEGFMVVRNMAITMPDFAWWLSVFVVVWLLLGIGRVWQSVRGWQRYRRVEKVGEKQHVETGVVAG